MASNSYERQFLAAYDEHADAIFRHCVFRIGDREKGKDLMQDAFMKVWQYIAKGNDVENLKALLYKTANNLITDEYRRSAKKKQESFEELQERGFDIASGEDTGALTHEMFTEQQVTRLLNAIKEPERSAVILRYIDELSPKEIADTLGVSANTVSVRISRGIKMLQSLVCKYG